MFKKYYFEIDTRPNNETWSIGIGRFINYPGQPYILRHYIRKHSSPSARRCDNLWIKISRSEV